jgi:hypothetical protein
MMNFRELIDATKRARSGFKDSYGEGREDNRIAFKRTRDDSEKDPDAVRIATTLGTNRTMTMLMEALRANPKQSKVFTQMGMGFSNDPATRVGQVGGHLAADLTQDRTRELWWLLNAPQAIGNVSQEAITNMMTRGKFEKSTAQQDRAGNLLSITNQLEAEKVGALDPQSGRLKKGYSMKDVDGDKIIYKRDYEPGHIEALQIPVGLAINSGIGLMNPFGGQEGYQAALPSEEDANKTSNVIGEVAAKYILGRTGNILPWDEFQKVRPDVSKGEYMAYKAFKFDKGADLNPFDDGRATIPSGVLKYNNDGIHGAEVQFLGRSLPLNTAILPTATAILGTALGARRVKRPIESGFIGGMSGALGGMAVGNALEDERRRRNAAENGIQL